VGGAAESHGETEPRGGTEPRVWSVVKASISAAGRDREQQFNAWYNQRHVPEWVAKPGFERGWRLRALDHPAQRQAHEHGYYAAYELESVSAFNDALAASHGAPWGEWQEYVGSHLIDWERTYYRVLAAIARDRVDAPYWAIVKTDFRGSDAQEREFNRWYDEVHLPELVSHTGFQGGWRLRVLPDAGDLGARRQRYWAVYRLRSIEDFVRARQARARRGLPPWDGLWTENLSDTRIDCYEMIRFQSQHALSAGGHAGASGGVRTGADE
jgi:hypothetical protein